MRKQPLVAKPVCFPKKKLPENLIAQLCRVTFGVYASGHGVRASVASAYTHARLFWRELEAETTRLDDRHNGLEMLLYGSLISHEPIPLLPRISFKKITWKYEDYC